MTLEVKVPVLPESVSDATIASWHKKPGDAVKRDEARRIPDWIDYGQIGGLSTEMRQKFSAHKPQTIAQAQAIDGVTPAAVTLVLSAIRRGSLRAAG